MKERMKEFERREETFHSADVAIAQLPRGDTPSDEKCGPFLGRC